MDKTTSPPTNGEVATRLDLSPSGVSRIRSGDRLPSLMVMATIEAEYGWDRLDQWLARDLGTYAEEFERAIRGEHQRDDTTPPR